jgi:hypothetical protein
MGAITHLVAGVPVSDLDASVDWYARFFDRPPDMRIGNEVLRDVDEHATLFIESNAAQAGADRITFAVEGLDIDGVSAPRAVGLLGATRRRHGRLS